MSVLLLVAVAAPVAAGENKFAAIAVEPATRHFGYSFDYSSRSGAEQRALRECRDRANVPANCRGIVWVRNGCAAAAYKVRPNGSNRYGWGIGETKSVAKARARDAIGTGHATLPGPAQAESGRSHPHTLRSQARSSRRRPR
jgi:hypothetical protein